MNVYVQVPCVVCRKPHWRPQNSRDARKTCSARCLTALQDRCDEPLAAEAAAREGGGMTLLALGALPLVLLVLVAAFALWFDPWSFWGGADG